jgi:hypothetical protein
MDTTETYIKMSEKARNYLPKWEPRTGDFVCEHGDTESIDVYCSCWSQEFSREIQSDDIPLYRQDQLQEMVFAEDLENGDIAYPLFRLSEYEKKGGYNASTFEQLWLAFVMKEKYNKVWNGEDWVNEKKET